MTEQCRNCRGWTHSLSAPNRCSECDGTGLESVRAAIAERRREDKL